MMITGLMFRDGVISGSNNIANNRQAVDALNIFPVPDGDTGTNMCLTIQTAVNELRKAEPATVDEAAKLTEKIANFRSSLENLGK